MNLALLRDALSWVARSCYRGWRILRRLRGSPTSAPPYERSPRPIVRHLPEGIDLRTRLDRRPAPELPASPPNPSPIPPLHPPGAAPDEAVILAVQAASLEENRRIENALVSGKFLAHPSRLRATGAVVQSALTSSTEPDFTAWISVTPSSPVRIPDPSLTDPPSLPPTDRRRLMD